MGDGTELWCPLCGEGAEYLSEEGDCMETHTMGYCKQCKNSFCVRIGVTVTEYAKELGALEA